jgi:hypothetical protein
MFSAVMLLAAACTSSGGSSSNAPAPSTTTSRNASLSLQQVLPLFLQCLVEHNVPVWDRAEGYMSLATVGEKNGWYENGRVVANNDLYLHADVLEGLYPMSTGFKPEQMISVWLDNAVSNGAWPKLCAPLP